MSQPKETRCFRDIEAENKRLREALEIIATKSAEAYHGKPEGYLDALRSVKDMAHKTLLGE